MYVLGWVSSVLYVFLCELAASPLRVHVYISACVLVCMCVYVNTRICVLPYMYALYVCLICCVAHACVHVCVCVLVCACPLANPPMQPYRYTLIIMTKFASNPTSYPPPHINLLPPNKQHRVSIEWEGVYTSVVWSKPSNLNPKHWTLNLSALWGTVCIRASSRETRSY